jgi:ribonuclease BN (tRNA processing enzyme)
MKWTVLGCHSPYPGPGGATPGYLLEADGKRILIDCGGGVLSQLARWLPPYELDGVILSHLHHDHISDFFILQYAIMTAMRTGKRKDPLQVWAPDQPAGWFAKLRYKDYIQLHMVGEGMTAGFGEHLQICFHRTDHAIPCYAMVISEGERTILYGADSGPGTDWTRMAEKPDLFVCEATYLHRDLPKQPTGHLSARQAAEAARRIGAKRLLLTHLFPEYDSEEILLEAEEVLGQRCLLAETGLIVEWMGANEWVMALSGEDWWMSVNGKSVDAWQDDERCPACSNRRMYHEEYDAYFCIRCDRWLEADCEDPSCEFCANRPDRPSLALPLIQT